MNKKIVDFITDCKVFYLATVDGDKPKVRPFGFIAEIDGKIYFCTGAKKDVYKQLEKNPNFEVSATAKDGRWIRVIAKAVLDGANENAKEKVLELMPTLKEIYKGEARKNFTVFYAKDVEAFLYSQSGAEKIS
ncbi:MAG: pyridoxamine 5'-phosphate oxidase family protein [Elusimicrobiota bacterium]|jgi:uncharacterized pyridoxamine 5'-phosphate oxidase family protein|nr:pyridoxamine 5'-phosphate oxidase family protein [Elusimicrobiota bacterium]